MPTANKELTAEIDQEGFQKTLRLIKVRITLTAQTSTKKLYQVLNNDELQIDKEVNEALIEGVQGGGEALPISDG